MVCFLFYFNNWLTKKLVGKCNGVFFIIVITDFEPMPNILPREKKLPCKCYLQSVFAAVFHVEKAKCPWEEVFPVKQIVLNYKGYSQNFLLAALKVIRPYNDRIFFEIKWEIFNCLMARSLKKSKKSKVGA